MGNLGPIISIIRISLRKRRKKGGRKCNVYETIGRVVLATRQPEIPWKQERKKKKKKGSLLHGSQRANFIRQLFSLPRLWTIPPFHRPIIIVRRFPTIPNFFLPLVRHSRSLCARNGGRVVGFEIRALESGVCRAVTRDLSRSTEVEAGLCLISSDPLIPSKSMFATKRPSSGIFYLMLLVSLHERRS